jgi:hypothetical protein
VCVCIHIYIYIYIFQDWQKKNEPGHISFLRGCRAAVPSFPQGATGFNSMDPQDEKTWKDGIRSLLDLSAWKRVADIGLESRACIEHIEVDKLLLCNNPKHLTCTSMVAFIGIWLNWHNPGDDPACPGCAHCANTLVGACVPPY